MRILITNVGLASRTGSELYIAELATRLRRSGHLPVVYTQILGPLGQALAEQGIAVVTDLQRIEERPDIIHGQHHLETVSACLAFPSTPAIHVCHGWLPWEELPPTLATIMTYVAVGPVTRERIVTHVRLDGRPVETVPVHYDDDGITPRGEIAPQPRRAIIYSNRVTPKSDASRAIAEACAQRGIEVRGVGMGFGAVVQHPMQAFGNCDLVFATGRGALEAIAANCGVVVCDQDGLAGFATRDRLDGIDGVLNLSSRSKRRLTAAEIGAEIDRYDADLVREAGAHIRATRPAARAVARYLEIYEDAITRFRDSPPSHEALLRDASRYLQSLAPMLRGRVDAGTRN